jgi:hypothetical protein
MDHADDNGNYISCYLEHFNSCYLLISIVNTDLKIKNKHADHHSGNKRVEYLKKMQDNVKNIVEEKVMHLAMKQK